MNNNDDQQRDESAERFLRLVQQRRRGRLKVYLGLAAGVGKTYRLLQEAHELRQHGVDVVLGYVETHGRPETVAQLRDLPRVPRKTLFYKGRALEEMDLEAIIQRRPAVAVVDELAHSNAPGSQHEKRWQDVDALLRAGISVLTALNVQHLESLHDQVLKITGTAVTERVPDQVLRQADEVVNVDLTVGELRARLEEGKIYAPARVPVALHNFFRADNLLQLRRLAVREVAQLLSRQVETEAGGAAPVPAGRRNHDRLLACISTNVPAARAIIRKASRLAQQLGMSPWYVLYVQTTPEAADRIKLETQRGLLRNLQLVTELGGQILRSRSDDVVAEIVRVARDKEATLLLCGMGRAQTGWPRVTRRSITRNLIRAVAGLEQSPDLFLVAC
ncbi:sensor protein KdpD [Hymenobacter sp. NST-14]|uniref:sensor protein KdpD n=1 Tax=Hymenobacter piscis TaxID=2839984 RepID=UPI001C027858|nr:sensor protein KdpD [Hymenobacter piscis]MBT9395496.1 sensor protein KdpD [Hymenobacter piscis]